MLNYRVIRLFICYVKCIYQIPDTIPCGGTTTLLVCDRLPNSTHIAGLSIQYIPVFITHVLQQ